jgi:HEAT repeat protein
MWNYPKSKKYLTLVTVLLSNIAVCTFAQEAELIQVLRSDAGVEEKSAACRQLARIGTAQSVPALAELLSDETLSHMARYALEPIPDASVDEALRKALGTVQGKPRLGVIGSLGVRRDAQAVEPLAGLLSDTDTALCQAAARALGDIGTPESAKALQDALSELSGPSQLAACEGLLRCAEALSADGQEALSQEVYDHLRELPDAAPQVAAAALRGTILSRGERAVPILLDAMHGPDYPLCAAAVRSAMELQLPAVTDALVDALPTVPAERQGLLIVALAERGESRVLPALLEATRSDDDGLRMQAFRALKRVGDASCVPALLEAAVGANEALAQAAIESLEAIQGQSVDEQLVAQLTEAEGQRRIVLVELVGRRRSAGAAPALWKAAEDSDPAVRTAALNALGSVIESGELPKLLARLSKTANQSEAVALDKAIQDVCLRAEDPDAVAGQLAAALPSVDTAAKARLLEMMNTIGGPQALEVVATIARSDDESLRDEAYKVLGQWKSAEVAPVLLELHNAVSDSRLKVRTVRAYIRVARQFDMPADQRAEMCRTALKIAEREADKRLVLEVLLRYPSEEMQAIALESAEDPALKDQAMLVVMGMASEGINRAELGRALAQAGQKPVKLEIIKAEYGAGTKSKDVTDMLRKRAKNYRIIFLPSTSYNASFGGDPAPGVPKQLKIKYRINGKEGEVSLTENATVVLPMPK